MPKSFQQLNIIVLKYQLFLCDFATVVGLLINSIGNLFYKASIFENLNQKRYEIEMENKKCIIKQLKQILDLKYIF